MPETGRHRSLARRLLVVQYAGDYAETWHRLAAGGGETYLAQAYGDRAVAALAGEGAEVTVLVVHTGKAYRETLAPRLVAIGLGPPQADAESAVIEVAKTFEPTDMLLRTPLTRVLAWAVASDARVLLTLADSFQGGLRRWLSSRRLVRLMNSPAVQWVGNHGSTASGALVRMGVDASKVVPWDWPHTDSPAGRPAKTLVPGRRRFKAIFVGARVELKGVGDALRAVARLADKEFDVAIDVVGEGDDYAPLATELRLGDRVAFLGRLPNAAIIAAMQQADVVLVPSRTAYPEGFPLTLYEALCARTPIVASDHPMFVTKLVADESAVIFPAGDAAALATSMERLLTSPGLYDALSSNALPTWQSLQVPVKWAELLRAWFDNTDDSRQWLQRHAWAATAYR